MSGPIPQSGEVIISKATDNVLSNRTIWIGSIVLVLVGAGAFYLLQRYFGTSEAAPKLEALKTAGTLIVGTGGAVALLLAARRQRSTELTLQETSRIAAETAADRAKDLTQREEAAKQERELREDATRQDRELREASAKDARHDAAERRITEIYAKAAEQLGADNAAVRLAGLYALERLANSSEDQQQAVVNVMCAYLRMPFAVVDKPDGDAGTSIANHELFQSQSEIEVRKAVQKILGDAVSAKSSGAAPRWRSLNLNLAGAHLFDLSWSKIEVDDIDLDGAHFYGGTHIYSTNFGPIANFREAKFHGPVWFDGCTFSSAEFGDIESKQGFHLYSCTCTDSFRMLSAELTGGIEIEESTIRHLDLSFSSILDESSMHSSSIQFIDLSLSRLTHSLSFPTDFTLSQLNLGGAAISDATHNSQVLGEVLIAHEPQKDGTTYRVVDDRWPEPRFD